MEEMKPSVNEKKLLRKLGEETLYSAKGHFKACDLRRNLVAVAIWGSGIASILDLMNIVADDRGFDVVGLLAAIALWIWNQGEGEKYRTKHLKAGEQYLSLHKKIRAAFLLPQATSTQALSDEVRKLDQQVKLEIPGAAR